MQQNTAPAVDMAMSPEEFAELRAQVAAIGQQDIVLGRVLTSLVLHLGHAHGLDPVVEDARLAAQALVLAREQEDARLKTEADELVETRAAEDALPHEPLQLEALKASRAAQDMQITADADALAKARAEEDAAVQAAKDAAAAQAEQNAQASAQPAQVAAPAPVAAPANGGQVNAS